MRIQLVNPYPEEFFQSQIMDCYPPLGILSIASFLQSMDLNNEIEVLDASLVTQEEIESSINADVVGISTTVGTYRNALRIAEKAKNRGARVVLGGPYASVLADRILSKREYIDCIVAGDGEEAFFRYIMGESLSEIENLVFMEKDRVIRNPLKTLDIGRLPKISFEFVDVGKYFANFRERFTFLGEKLGFSKELPIYSRKGCTWRLRGGCIFCSIFDRTYRLKPPKRVWEEIEELIRRYEVNGIYDVSDEFLSNTHWLKEFVEIVKSSNEDVYFVLMGRANLVTDFTADLLSELNCVRIFVGIECGDQRMLDNMSKGITIQDNVNAVKLLSERGIKVTAGVVLGAPREDEESLENTMELFDSLIAFGNLDVIDPNVLIPLPGSSSFSRLISVPKMQDKYGGSDVFDARELQRDWVRCFCDIGFEDLLQAIDMLRSKVKLSLY